MFSSKAIHLGLCLQRCGLQLGVANVFCRQRRSIAVLRSTNSVKCPPSCGITTSLNQRKQFTVDSADLMKGLKVSRYSHQFIVDPKLVDLVLQAIKPFHNATTPLLEFNPGPGLLTLAFLNAGYNVVALEKDLAYLPSLKKLEDAYEQLRVFHCDFYQFDPVLRSNVQPPVMFFSQLMEALDITAVPWHAESPVRILGMLTNPQEKNILWRQIYAAFERFSIFEYGRIECVFFISEHIYKNLLTKPGNATDYTAFVVLFNLAFEIQMLEKVQMTSFFPSRTSKRKKMQENDNGCNMVMVRITPRENMLFKGFTKVDCQMFVYMVTSCLIKRKKKLITFLESWSPGEGIQIVQELGIPENVSMADLPPETFIRLYKKLMELSHIRQNFMFFVENSLPSTVLWHRKRN